MMMIMILMMRNEMVRMMTMDNGDDVECDS